MGGYKATHLSICYAYSQEVIIVLKSMLNVWCTPIT